MDYSVSYNDYHPISLTSVVGKILESIIDRDIRDHLEKHDLIHDSMGSRRLRLALLT